MQNIPAKDTLLHSILGRLRVRSSRWHQGTRPCEPLRYLTLDFIEDPRWELCYHFISFTILLNNSLIFIRTKCLPSAIYIAAMLWIHFDSVASQLNVKNLLKIIKPLPSYTWYAGTSISPRITQCICIFTSSQQWISKQYPQHIYTCLTRFANSLQREREREIIQQDASHRCITNIFLSRYNHKKFYYSGNHSDVS